MKRWVRNIAVLSVGVAVLALVPGAASAQDDDVDVQLGDDTQVVLNGRVLVSDTETVDGVVLFNGTASIEGVCVPSVTKIDRLVRTTRDRSSVRRSGRVPRKPVQKTVVAWP